MSVIAIIILSAATTLFTKYVILGEDLTPLLDLGNQIGQAMNSNLFLILLVLFFHGCVYIIFKNPDLPFLDRLFGRSKPQDSPSLKEILASDEPSRKTGLTGDHDNG